MNMTIKIFCDGGARGNPGPAACAFVAHQFKQIGADITDRGRLLEKKGKYLGVGTNNEAEYWAIIEAWKWLTENLTNWANLSHLIVEFYLDSKLVVNQINGVFKVKEPRLWELLRKVQEGEGVLPLKATYSYVPREKNFEADLLVNQTLDKKRL